MLFTVKVDEHQLFWENIFFISPKSVQQESSKRRGCFNHGSRPTSFLYLSVLGVRSLFLRPPYKKFQIKDFVRNRWKYVLCIFVFLFFCISFFLYFFFFCIYVFFVFMYFCIFCISIFSVFWFFLYFDFFYIFVFFLYFCIFCVFVFSVFRISLLLYLCILFLRPPCKKFQIKDFVRNRWRQVFVSGRLRDRCKEQEGTPILHLLACSINSAAILVIVCNTDCVCTWCTMSMGGSCATFMLIFSASAFFSSTIFCSAKNLFFLSWILLSV